MVAEINDCSFASTCDAAGFLVPVLGEPMIAKQAAGTSSAFPRAFSILSEKARSPHSDR
ncbi:MAG TPA: hypothetical protein PK867_10015 [Pirellulales bacterium]|nr:hypothetical protein [Pirellulales bacterium]